MKVSINWHRWMEQSRRHLRLARYLLRNSYRETNQSKAARCFALLRPIIQSLGFMLFYSYIIRPGLSGAALSPIIIDYFVFTLVIASVDLGKFLQQLQDQIASEQYLAIDRLPISPFYYYLCLSLGKNAITLGVLLVGGLIFFSWAQLPLTIILLYLPSVLIGLFLAHLLYFTLAQLSFYADQLNLWSFTIVFALLSGQMIPLAVLPTLVQRSFTLLPFSYTAGAFASNLSRRDSRGLILSLGLSLLWCLLLMRFSGWLWRRGSSAFQERN